MGIYLHELRGHRGGVKGAMRCRLQLPKQRRKTSARLFKSISMPGKALMSRRFLPNYSDDVVIHLPTGTLKGKPAVRDNFVRPFIAAFPGNVHAIRNLAHAKNLVAVEWSFEAVHTGAFANVEATGNQVQVPGCSFYEYDLGTRTIPAGRIYFDLSTLLRQIGAAA
jgi:predicted ester cyclase